MLTDNTVVNSCLCGILLESKTTLRTLKQALIKTKLTRIVVLHINAVAVLHIIEFRHSQPVTSKSEVWSCRK